MFEPNNSTSLSAGQIYKGIVNAIGKIREHRDYLQDGTLYLGERKKTGYFFPQQHWAISPEALFGLAQDTVAGFGERRRARAHQLLAHITGGEVPAGHTHASGWLGHERSVRVGGKPTNPS